MLAAGYGTLGLGHGRLEALEPTVVDFDGARVRSFSAASSYAAAALSACRKLGRSDAAGSGQIVVFGVNSHEGRLGLGVYERNTHALSPELLDIASCTPELRRRRVVDLVAGRFTLWVVVEGEAMD